MTLLFDLDLLRRQLKHVSWVPPNPPARVVGAWDTAFTNSDWSDDSVGCCGVVTEPSDADKSVLWLRHIEFGRIAPAQLPAVVAKFYERWTPERSVIEMINGSEFLKILVNQEAERLNIHPAITWMPASRSKAAKQTRIERLVRLHLADRLRIVAASWNDEFLHQAEMWTGTARNKTRQDSLLDACAYLVRFVPV